MRLLCWNIQWCRGVDGRVDPVRIARNVKETADADVICFQEVARNFPSLAGSRGEDQFALLAAAFPSYAAVEGIAVDVADSDGRGQAAGDRHQFGNLLLSRLPVRQAFRHLLPWPADPVHADMQRVAIEASIETHSGPLRVTTTHLAYYSREQRAAQVESLRGLHAQARSHARQPSQADVSGGPFHWRGLPGAGIVMGDFNFEPDSAEHARMLAPFADGSEAFRDAWQVTHPGLPHAPTVGMYDRDQWPHPFCCDFMFVSDDLAPRIREFSINAQSQASDHQPLLLELD